VTTTPSLLEGLGLVPVVNATGATSRLGGNLLSPAARDAMLAAGQSYIPLDELQARASEAIAHATGAEAGCVASGAAACLFLAAAASMTGTDIAAMDRLPDTLGLRNEIVLHRAHRNPYDHALRRPVRGSWRSATSARPAVRGRGTGSLRLRSRTAPARSSTSPPDCRTARCSRWRRSSTSRTGTTCQ
jgi:hypothetical protein